MDWKSPVDWIGSQLFLLLEKNEHILAALACPPELPQMTWVRLFAVHSDIKADKAWKLLWEKTLNEYFRNKIIHISALSMQTWFNEILEGNNFNQTDNVIVLLCENFTDTHRFNHPDIKIRQMMPEDLKTVATLDNSSFDIEWRISQELLELAYQQSTYTTVAEMGDEIIAYQYSTSGGSKGHLARLAVKGKEQGKGVGYSLILDVLNHYKLRGITQVTVNTQQSNVASLALYSKAGFQFTGERYRVYTYIK
jgi:ribosomal protein S18 acetylase RimI-like enzyme